MKRHYIKLMMGYWFIFVIFVPMGLFFGRKFWGVYDVNPLFALIDFFGLAYLFGTPTFNVTWWYMGVIIIFYLIFPFLIKIYKYSLEFLLVALIFIPFPPDFLQIKMWLFPFMVGMFLAKYDVFTKLAKRVADWRGRFILCGGSVMVTALVRYMYLGTSAFDGFFALAIVMTSFLFISKIPVLNRILEELGSYSADIFMFHSFILRFYFEDFIYWFKYPIVIFTVLVVICYGIARGLQVIKSVTHYDRLTEHFIKR